MKNYLSILIAFMLMALVSCQPKQKTEPVDKETAEKEVAVVLDNLHTLLKAKDIETYSGMLSDDGLYCGTDSKEFWDKASLIKLQKEFFSNPDFEFDYEITKRVIRVAEDGKSALSIEQFVSNEMFPRLPVRFTTHLIKIKKGWTIDFMGWSLVPDNEDMEKLVNALKQ